MQRGQNYFASGLVEELEETEPEFWQAWVEGSNSYDIKITSDGDNNEWQKDFLSRQKYRLLMQWARHDEAIALVKQHMDVTEFREHFVKQAIENKDFAEAKRLLNEGITIAKQKNHPGVVPQWQEILLDIARREDDKPAIRHGK